MEGCTDKWVFRDKWVDRQTDRVQYGTLFDTTKPRIRLTLGKLINLFVPQLCHLYNENIHNVNSTYIMRCF